MILHPIPTPRSIPAILLLATIGLAAGAPAQTAPPPGLDAYVHEVMETFEVPGLALAIVKDGEVVLAEGYGVRHLGEPAPVDPHTLFGIASNTKAFTATAIGILVEEGKLSWDQPVIDVLPSFRMSDPYVTAELTVRDLLVHRSGLGLGAGDLLFWPGTTYDRDEIVHRLRYVPIENSFRATYNYDNVLYMVAGEVIEAASGMPWESFVETRILEPLGMRDTRAGLIAATPDSNIAYTHARVEGVVRVVEPDTTRSIAPAGGIMSSATDMARWLDVQLARGRLGDGDSLFSQATSRELWTLVTPLEPGPHDLLPHLDRAPPRAHARRLRHPVRGRGARSQRPLPRRDDPRAARGGELDHLGRRDHVQHEPDDGQQGHDDRRPVPGRVLPIGDMLLHVRRPAQRHAVRNPHGRHRGGLLRGEQRVRVVAGQLVSA